MRMGAIIENFANIGTVMAATLALITTYQNKKMIKDNKEELIKMDRERHATKKPIFIVNETYHNPGISSMELKISNIGYPNFGDMNVSWHGKRVIKTSLVRDYDKGNDSYVYIIILNLIELENIQEDVSGKLVLSYDNILGKTYCEKIDIHIEVNPEFYMKSVNSKQFK